MGRRVWVVACAAALAFACEARSALPTGTGAGGAAETIDSGGAIGAVGGGLDAGGAAEPGADATASVGPTPPVDGLWFMYGFEDPLSIDLAVGSGATPLPLRGTGCYSGPQHLIEALDGKPLDFGESGPLAGVASGASLSFDVAFPKAGTTYAAKVFASRDGTRMAGEFLIGKTGTALDSFSPVLGWIRLEALGYWRDGGAYQNGVPVAADLGPLGNIEWGTSPGFLNGEFTLQGNAPIGRLQPGVSYRASGRCAVVCFVVGELGTFWSPDFHWDAATSTLIAGPAPETIPGLPVELRLRYGDDLVLRDAVVRTADGATGTLVPVPASP